MRRLYFDGNNKECINGHIKPIAEFYPHNKSKQPNMSCYYRPYCKECHNAINIRKALEKRRRKFPNSFWDCDHCDHIVSVTKIKCDKCNGSRT
jgi:hypothetical protein